MAQTRLRKAVRNRLKPLQNPEEMARRMDKMKENQTIKIVLIMLLPIIFLVLGILMYPPWGKKEEVKLGTIIESVGGGGEGGTADEREEEKKLRGEEKMNNNREKRLVQEMVSETYEEMKEQRERTNLKEDSLRENEASVSDGVKKKSVTSNKDEQKVPKFTDENKYQGKGEAETIQVDVKPILEKKKLTVRQDRKEEDLHQQDGRNFQPTFQRMLRIGKVEVEGKRLKGVEIKPPKSHNSSIRVYAFNNFLTDRECNGLIRAHKKHVEQFSEVDPIFCFDDIFTLEKYIKDAKKQIKITHLDFIPETSCLQTKYSAEFKTFLKWSTSTAFYPGESPFSMIFENRVKQATGLNPSNGGKLQVTSYGVGIGYKTHTDCILGNTDQRDRVATILVYLADVPEGGETEFPELGIKVKPKKGMAIVWNNMNADGICEPLSLHTAAVVKEGHKYILQRWYYYKSFVSLGQRPSEPSIPERLPHTARVNCDEFEHGSCRWYDEWNYDHMPEWLMNRRNLA